MNIDNELQMCGIMTTDEEIVVYINADMSNEENEETDQQNMKMLLCKKLKRQ